MLPALAATVAGAALFWTTLAPLDRADERAPDAWAPEFAVVLPPGLATVMAGGDPYLAANLQVIRGNVVATRLEGAEQKALFTRLLRNAIQLNPAHEDGYYLAQAVLPWNGYIEVNQEIQAAAAEARPRDWLPLFFQAFNRYYFLREPGPASDILRKAAGRASPDNRQSLLANAARWRAVGQDPEEALRIIRGMVKGAPEGPLRRNLRARQVQLQGLLKLRQAAEAYRRDKGKPPDHPEALLGYSGLEEIPEDPFGEGYVIGDSGRIVITPPKPLREDFDLSEELQ